MSVVVGTPDIQRASAEVRESPMLWKNYFGAPQAQL
jgi:hypothetical protein